MTEAEELGAELADFRRRVAELRAARSLPSAEQLPALDAALIELQHAADVLWPRYERLAARHRGHHGRRGDGHEQQLLRALFQRLPVPAMLLDRDTVVRRLNVAATQLFGMRAGYATGRSLATSLAREGRAAFRSQVAAVARGEGERSLVVHLLRPPEVTSPDDGALRATLTALRPPRETRAAVLAVFQRAIAGAPVSEPPRAASHRPRTPDLHEVSRHTRLLDLVDDMATALLRIPLDEPAPPGEDRVATVAERAADVLGASFADWVVVDVVDVVDVGNRVGPVDRRDRTAALDGVVAANATYTARPVTAASGVNTAGAVNAVDGVDGVDRAVGPDGLGGGTVRRVHVAGPDAQVRRAIAAQHPLHSPLVADAVRHGAEALQVRPEDPEALGRDATGAPVLLRAEVGSVLCVPLTVPGTPPVGGRVGALTLLRTGGRRPFELAETAAVERMARHLALALHRSLRRIA